MPETSASLLERLGDPADAAAWSRLTDLYTPLIRKWLRPYHLQASDVDDLTQEVLAALVKDLPAFRHNARPGAFRHWLRVTTVHRLRAFLRDGRRRAAPGGGCFDDVLDQLEDPDSPLSRHWDEEHDRHVARRLQELIEPEFRPASRARQQAAQPAR